MATHELDTVFLEKPVVLTIDSLEHELEQFKQDRTEAIAVIGMGCRFPGDSCSPEAFWQMLAEGRDAVKEMPIERYDIDEFYHPDINMPGKTVSRCGAFLEHIDEFDPGFFGISPREAMYMDPQHRILLEVTWEALERAGVQPEKLMGSSTGVFMGLFNKDYSHCVQDQAVATRGANANASYCSLFPHFASGRISYHLGLQGPSMTVDTACSSSLVAVHLACQSLRNEECQMALAGGVDLRFHPWEGLVHSKMRLLSPRGRCRTFDESADGFVRGEGCGVVVLKRYSQALADGDSILALIRGSAVNSDGRSNGLTAPNGKAQEAVLRQALRNSGVGPEQISYIEAHGTGTRLGDPIEFESLKNVIGQAHPEGSVCMLGSVKTNIGHLEAASGMAGLVKVILCLQHQAIPPHLHLEKLNPLINLEQTPFVIPKHLSPWSSAGPRYAGVSASGLSGTNAHIVLEEISESTWADPQPLSLQRIGATWLLPLSAKNADGLRQLAQAWHSELQAPNSLSNASLRHICSTASLRRTHYQHRLALVGASHGELTKQLAAFLRKEAAPGMSIGLASHVKPRPVFIFSGQGAQWVGMGQELIKHEAVFRTALEKCDVLLRKYVSWSLLVELKADEKQSRLHETAIAQPALFSLQVALTELWHSWGIEPAAVVGHSVGEITAAYVAGVLDLDDAIRIVVQRGALMQQTHGQGYMAAVEIPETQAREFLVDYAGRVAIAAVNSPTNVVLSGETAALHEVLQNMLQANVHARELNVKNAFHSPQMEPLRNIVVGSLQGIKPKLAKLLLLSTVTGEPSSGEDYNASYWGRNVCETVYFGPAIEKILDMGYHTFLEISPHPVLARSVKQCLAHQQRSGVTVSSMRRGISERKSMLTALGTLYTHGFPDVKWEQLYQTSSWESNKVVPLPTYPWQHKRYWFSDKIMPFSHQAPTATPGRLTGHPLLGRRVRAATRDHIIYETTISIKAFPWLVDHQAFGMPVFPASAYIEMMHESVRMALKYDDVHLIDLFFPQALALSPDEERVVQLVLVQSSSDNRAGEITILSCSDSDADADVWTLHANCHYQPGKQGASIATVPELTDMDIVRQRCTESTSGVEHYEKISATGLEIGPAFQGLQHIWWRQGEALGKLCLPEQVSSERRSYFMHPALLDSCIQTAAATVWAKDKQGEYLYLPVSLDRVFFHQRPGREIWVHTTLSMVDLNHGLNLQMRLLSERGEPIALIDGINIRRAPPSALSGQPRLSALNWLYNLQWNQKAHHGVLHEDDYISSANPKSWLVFCDKKGIGARLTAQLRQRGEQCLLIFADQHYQKMKESESCDYTVDPSRPDHLLKLLEDCVPLLKYHQCGIVYLWGVDAKMTPEGTPEQLVQEQEKLCGGLLHLVQAVLDKLWATSPQLWVMTQNSQDVKVPSVSGTTPSGVLQSQLWGLGRAIAHDNLQCRLVDLPDQDSWDIDTLLLQELLDPESEDQIALRMEGRYIARLAVAESDVAFMRKQKQHINPVQDHKALQFNATGTYIITGGFGGLGIEIAQWMVEQRGVRHLVLTGRRDPTPEVLSIINLLEQRGAQILSVKTDVADQNQVAQLLKTIEEAAIPLRGIIHSAGVLDDGVLVRLKWERFAKVLAPKVQGSWNLHLLTRDISLDFFVLFSSISSILPMPGQANYAAANAFVDGLAHYRRSLGLPAISINWGAWANMGMTKDSASFERRLALDGVQLISREQGMVAFEQVLLDDPVQIAVFPIDTSILKGMRAGRQEPIFSDLIGEYPRPSKVQFTAEADELLAYKQIPYAVRFQERPELMLEDVSRQAVKVLGLDPSAHLETGWNLFEVGLDSIMALELRNAIQKETGLSVPANLVFTHPTVGGIAASLAGHLSPVPA